MNIQPEYKQINYKEQKVITLDGVRVECKMAKPSEQVGRILNLSAHAFTPEVECVDSGARYNGKVAFYLSFKDKDGGIGKSECGAEISGDIPLENRPEYVGVMVKVIKSGYDLSGEKVSVFAELEISAKVITERSESLLVGGEKVIVKREESQLQKSLGVQKSTYPIEEEFELSYAVEEVLSHKAQGVITAVQSGIGSIIVDGKVLIWAIMLQKGDKRVIIKEEKEIPFRAEIEYEQATPDLISRAWINQKSFKVDVLVDDEGDNSTVRASAYFALEGEVFLPETVEVSVDAFSPCAQLSLGKKELLLPSEAGCEYLKICSKIAVDNPKDFGEITCVADQTVEYAGLNGEQGQNLLCQVAFTIYCIDDEGGVFTKRVKGAFDYQLDGQSQLAGVEVCNANAKVEGQEVVITFDCYLCLIKNGYQSASVIESVEFVKEKEVVDCAISVYIPTENEELWSMAKRLSVCPESLLETNKDLTFPLTGKERILVYRRIE